MYKNTNNNYLFCYNYIKCIRFFLLKAKYNPTSNLMEINLDDDEINLIKTYVIGTRSNTHGSCRHINKYNKNAILRLKYCSFLRNCWKQLAVALSISLSSQKDLEVLKRSYLLAKICEAISNFCCCRIVELEFNHETFYFISNEGMILYCRIIR